MQIIYVTMPFSGKSNITETEHRCSWRKEGLILSVSWSREERTTSRALHLAPEAGKVERSVQAVRMDFPFEKLDSKAEGVITSGDVHSEIQFVSFWDLRWACVFILSKKSECRTSLVLQWLRLCLPSAGGPSLIPGWATRYRRLQLRVCFLKTKKRSLMSQRRSKIFPIPTKTQSSQINIYIFYIFLYMLYI